MATASECCAASPRSIKVLWHAAKIWVVKSYRYGYVGRWTGRYVGVIN